MLDEFKISKAMYRFIAFTTGFFFFSSPLLAQSGATFEGLGDLSGGLFESWAYGLSGDGSVVVGYSQSTSSLNDAFRWEDGELESLGDLPGGDFISRAYAASLDGSVIVGYSNSDNGNEAFRWEDAEMVGLGALPGSDFFSSYANDVSSDGLVVVGNSVSDQGGEAFRWETEADTMVGLGDLPGGSFNSSAFATSADGSVVVGQSSSENGYEAFLWEVDADTMVGLGDLPGGIFLSSANAVSSDGSVVVGQSGVAEGSEAFRWEDGELIALGDLSGGFFSSNAYGVSDDGSIVIGSSNSDNGNEAFIWSEAEGMHPLKEVLESDYGLDLNGWYLINAEGISGDGSVIVGYGDNPDGSREAWRAFLGQPIADEGTPEVQADVLSAPIPNPARTTSTFTVSVKESQHVRVEVFDVTGRRVQTLYQEARAGGMSKTFTLDVSVLSPGVYVVRAAGEAPGSGSGTGFAETRRLTVLH